MTTFGKTAVSPRRNTYFRGDETSSSPARAQRAKKKFKNASCFDTFSGAPKLELMRRGRMETGRLPIFQKRQYLQRVLNIVSRKFQKHAMFFHAFGARGRSPKPLTKHHTADGHGFRLRFRHALKLTCSRPSRSQDGSDMILNVTRSAGSCQHLSLTMCQMASHSNSI